MYHLNLLKNYTFFKIYLTVHKLNKISRNYRITIEAIYYFNLDYKINQIPYT